ncbi:MAG: hypothetical protein JNN15_12565 [Blastocatellia bacterium]|nr:hypothetical protein [Blastocatellia bacterium]
MAHLTLKDHSDHDLLSDPNQVQAHNYWTVLQGEFPWCLDDSDETDAPSDLIGLFDLLFADPPRSKKSLEKSSSAALERAKPDTQWVCYAELFLKDQGSLLLLSPLESIGGYLNAFSEAGLQHQATYIWYNSSIQTHEAVLWASKEEPKFKPCLPEFLNFLSSESTNIDQKASLIELLVRTFSEEEMTVLEPFASDNQLLTACQKLHRHCLSIVRKRTHLRQIVNSMMLPLKQTA